MTATTDLANVKESLTPRSRVGAVRLLLRSVRTEATKLRTVRTTHGALLLTVVCTAGVAALLGWGVSTSNVDQPDARAVDLATVGLGFGQFGVLALAALTVTSEFGSGAIRTTLAVMPARWAVVCAKAIVVAGYAFVGAFVAFVVAMYSAAAVLDTRPGDVLEASALAAAATAAMAALVLGIGALLRGTAVTVLVAVALVLAPTIVAASVTNDVIVNVLGYLPAGLGEVVTGGQRDGLGPWAAAALLGAWVVLVLGAGTRVLSRRDT
jgi:ABC-2 type transport system permease protein